MAFDFIRGAPTSYPERSLFISGALPLISGALPLYIRGAPTLYPGRSRFISGAFPFSIRGAFYLGRYSLKPQPPESTTCRKRKLKRKTSFQIDRFFYCLGCPREFRGRKVVFCAPAPPRYNQASSPAAGRALKHKIPSFMCVFPDERNVVMEVFELKGDRGEWEKRAQLKAREIVRSGFSCSTNNLLYQLMSAPPLVVEKLIHWHCMLNSEWVFSLVSSSPHLARRQQTSTTTMTDRDSNAFAFLDHTPATVRQGMYLVSCTRAAT
ncbi:hypothetical protein BC567DRAFT_281384 [Phyllosticta citribraziliensis]